MAKFFDTLKSAFVVVEEDKKQEQKEEVVLAPMNDVKTQVNKTDINEVTVNAINQGLLDKLCERLEAKNFPGPDYMELKTAMNDEFIMEAVPDESKRMAIAFKTLKSSTPTLTKEHVIDTLDKYIGFLKEWEKEAIDDINVKRSEVHGKKKEIEDITKQMNELLQKRNELQVEVDSTEDKCNRNENDMVTAVGFLVKKLEEDKNKIKAIL